MSEQPRDDDGLLDEVMRDRPVPSGDDAEALLVAFLKDRSAQCPLCQYNLRGVSTATCPECGRHIELTVHVDERIHTDWFIAFALAFSGFPISGIALVIAGASSFTDLAEIVGELPGIVGMFLLTAIAIPLLVFRRWFIRLRHDTKSTIAIAVGIIWFLTFGAFFGQILVLAI